MNRVSINTYILSITKLVRKHNPSEHTHWSDPTELGQVRWSFGSFMGWF